MSPRRGEAGTRGVEESWLEAFAGGRYPQLCWLDGGGVSRSVLGREPVDEISGDSLELLDEVEARFRHQPSRPWIGWLSYDLGAAAALEIPVRSASVPHLVMRQFSRLELGAAPELGAEALTDWPLRPLEPELAPELYRARVEAARAYICAGDTYQVNLSQTFRAPWTERAGARPFTARVAELYRRLAGVTPASMGALISVDEHAAIVSNSPETLIDVRFGSGGQPDRARSWPIKGTRPRFRDPVADAQAIAALRGSEKDLAEHVMIVDLVRHELGMLARPGSVCAPPHPSVVSLPTVHHLVSEVSCELAPGWGLHELFRALFPGGSVTGAPKRRTLEIIDELEGEARGIYCGAIVLLEQTGLRVSIPIRTGVLSAAGLELRSGGGIVFDSDPESERLETLAKARAFDSREWS